MRRRDLILGMASAASFGSRSHAGNPPRVGVLDPGLGHLFDAFYAGMRELGYAEGQTVVYERRVSVGCPEELARDAAELVQSRADIIVTAGPPAVLAVMQATTTIPVVFAAVGDAVGSGVVATLAHPDRNATGLSFLNTEIASKRVELLREMLPQARRIAILSYRLGTSGTREAGLDAARALGIESPVFAVGDPDEFDDAFAQAVAARAEAMNVLASPFFNAHRERLVAVAQNISCRRCMRLANASARAV